MRYVTQRLVHAVLVLLGVSIVVFVLVRLTGDPASLLVSVDARPEDLERYRRALGLDLPWYKQFWHFVYSAVQGDFGTSLRHHEPAMGLVLDRMPATLLLAGAAMVLAYTFPVVAGVYSALRPNSTFDFVFRIIAVAGQCIPSFSLGLLLILIVSVRLRWLPPVATGDWKGLILPALTLSAYFMATNTRLVRSAMMEVLKQDYIRTARSKGLSERVTVYRHALKNASIPVVTMAGLQFGALVGGAMVTETVFAYPGMGLLAIQAIQGRDFPVVQAFVLVVAAVIVGVNLVTDMTYPWLDPRVRLEA